MAAHTVAKQFESPAGIDDDQWVSLDEIANAEARFPECKSTVHQQFKAVDDDRVWEKCPQCVSGICWGCGMSILAVKRHDGRIHPEFTKTPVTPLFPTIDISPHA